MTIMPCGRWRQRRSSGWRRAPRRRRTDRLRLSLHCVVVLIYLRRGNMIIGVPREIKDHETRVGLVPSGVTALRETGHEVLVETLAGEGSSITDREYMQAGAHIVDSAAGVWSKADLVVKVKEPQPAEYPHFRPGLILFTYLHLAPLPELTDRLLD